MMGVHGQLINCVPYNSELNLIIGYFTTPKLSQWGGLTLSIVFKGGSRIAIRVAW